MLGGYLAFYAYTLFGIHPFVSILIAAPLFFALGYALQRTLINRMIAAPVLLTLSLTFGLDLILSNGMLVTFTADFKKLTLDPPLGVLNLGGIVLPVDRLFAAQPVSEDACFQSSRSSREEEGLKAARCRYCQPLFLRG